MPSAVSSWQKRGQNTRNTLSSDLINCCRYRSARAQLSCPSHSQPYKCVCLGEDRRTRGNITDGLCQCGPDTRQGMALLYSEERARGGMRKDKDFL